VRVIVELKAIKKVGTFSKIGIPLYFSWSRLRKLATTRNTFRIPSELLDSKRRSRCGPGEDWR
jgi:hypothetical protein